MENEKKNLMNEARKTGGLLFVGSMFIGMAIGFYTGAFMLGLFGGMGVGFIMMGVVNLSESRKVK